MSTCTNLLALSAQIFRNILCTHGCRSNLNCALNKDDICDLHGQAPVLRHGQGRAPGQQLRTELGPEHVRAHPSEETQGERVTERMDGL